MTFNELALVFFVFATLFLSAKLLKPTVLGLKSPSQPMNWWVFLFYRQIALVLSAPIFLTILGVDSFSHFGRFITDDYAYTISWIVLYAVLAFVFSLSVGLQVFNLRRVKCSCDIDLLTLLSSRRFAISAAIVGGLLLTSGLLLFGHKHALLGSIFFGENIRAIRGYNAYHSAFPGIASSFVAFCSWIPAIHSGYEAKRKKYLFSLLFLLLALVFAGVRGDKAPIVECFLLFGMSYAIASKKAIGFKVVVTGVLGFSFLFIVVYNIVKLQNEGYDIALFLSYLLDRLGVGQMQGSYVGIHFLENKSDLPDNFWLNLFPLSSKIEPHLSVSKYIMLGLSGRAHDETGVMNSLFISEAFGIGGWFLLFLSPFVVGLSIAISFKLFYEFLALGVGRKVSGVYYIPLSLLSLNITGGFSQFPLQRSFITVSTLLGLVFLVNWFLVLLRKRFARPKACRYPVIAN